jgi:protein NUD1
VTSVSSHVSLEIILCPCGRVDFPSPTSFAYIRRLAPLYFLQYGIFELILRIPLWKGPSTGHLDPPSPHFAPLHRKAEMEPWLDSLSDEWASNGPSSSPKPSSSSPPSETGSRTGVQSQSRIPRLPQNHSQRSVRASSLRPRPTIGLVRAETLPILTEQTSSQSNVAAYRAGLSGRSTAPRKVSSAVSGSVNSIQHHTIAPTARIGDENTPEWKRRLARGDDVGGDGCDLFGPSRLEGMFKQPRPTNDAPVQSSSPAAQPMRPWAMPEQYQSRQPSVTTQDFLYEATKIMQIIRQRGKPKSGLGSVEEPSGEAGINPDSILDLDIEGEDSTADDFSRPPSRNGSTGMRRGRVREQDPVVASHLQRYQDGDELDLLLSSKLGSLHFASQPPADQAALVPLPDDEDTADRVTVSSEGNIRIRESQEHQKKRKRSTSSLDGPPSLQTQGSSGTSTGTTTIPTTSSASSGNKGRIPPGMVDVPDQVGVMTFDHSTKSWVRGRVRQSAPPMTRKTNSSEEDPFGDIPDLSIDEQREAGRQALLRETVSSRLLRLGGIPKSNADEIQRSNDATRPGETSVLEVEDFWDARDDSRDQADLPCMHELSTVDEEEVEYEIQVHDGRAVEAPPSPHRTSKRARAVTVAFSSPLVSAIAGHDDSILPEEEFSSIHRAASFGRMQLSASQNPRSLSSVKMFVGQPVARIEEQDEGETGHDLSVVHVSQTVDVMTPMQQKTRKDAPVVAPGAASLICLTPLSEFTLHQVDQPLHLEASYVAQRAHPNSLQQAHGSLTLAVDELIRAINQAEPHELYWEHIRRLDLTEKGLEALHCLEEYCGATEELRISRNRIRQLSGIPRSVRTLVAQNNCLSGLTAWGHLQNLQYLDISGNKLESLDGLSCLPHLRELKANRNQIRNLEGILDLDGLLHLELRSNDLSVVDFEGAELTRLHHLDLSDNLLISVHGIHQLTALRTLHLEKNKLDHFDVASEICSLLVDLRLSSNQIEDIDLSTFPSIEVLYLDKNRVHSVHGLSVARHLHTLSLREQSDSPDILNTILSVSSECRKVYLSSNLTPPMGLTMASLPQLNLKYLELSSCGLTTLLPGFGNSLPNCRTLNLNFNAIQDLRPLRGCTRLNKLLVAGNRLSKLRATCASLTRLLPALSKLDLRNNPLTVGFYTIITETSTTVSSSTANTKIRQMPMHHPLPPDRNETDTETETEIENPTPSRPSIPSRTTDGSHTWTKEPASSATPSI